MKKIIRDIVLFAIIISLGFTMGYIRAKKEIMTNALANKKDCYDLIDIYNIVNP